MSAGQQESAVLERFETFMSALIDRIDRVQHSQQPVAPQIMVSEPDPRTMPPMQPAGDLFGPGAFTHDLYGDRIQYDGTNSVIDTEQGMDEDALLWTANGRNASNEGDPAKRPASSSTYRLMGDDIQQWQLSAAPLIAEARKRPTNESIYGDMDVTRMTYGKQLDKSDSIISRLGARSPLEIVKPGSPNPSTKASTGHIRDKRQETFRRLDGSHPDVVSRMPSMGTQQQSGAFASKWSPETMTNKALPSRDVSKVRMFLQSSRVR